MTVVKTSAKDHTLRLYHGTHVRFDRFDPTAGEGLGTHFADGVDTCRRRLADDALDGWILACDVDLRSPLEVVDQRIWSPAMVAYAAAEQRVYDWDDAKAHHAAIVWALTTDGPTDSLAATFCPPSFELPDGEAGAMERLQAEWEREGFIQAVDEENDFEPVDDMLWEVRRNAPAAAAMIDREVSTTLIARLRDDLVANLQRAGHDSLVYRNKYEGGTSYVAFHAEQILRTEIIEEPENTPTP